MPLPSGHDPVSAASRGATGAAPANASGTQRQEQKMNQAGSKFELSSTNTSALSGTDTHVCGPSISASPKAPANSLQRVARKHRIKWDTVPLNSRPNSLKTNGSAPKQVGHFSDSRAHAELRPAANTRQSKNAQQTTRVPHELRITIHESRITRNRVSHHAKQNST